MDTKIKNAARKKVAKDYGVWVVIIPSCWGILLSIFLTIPGLDDHARNVGASYLIIYMVLSGILCGVYYLSKTKQLRKYQPSVAECSAIVKGWLQENEDALALLLEERDEALDHLHTVEAEIADLQAKIAALQAKIKEIEGL
jgi:hypothetical protein